MTVNLIADVKTPISRISSVYWLLKITLIILYQAGDGKDDFQRWNRMLKP